MDQCLYSQVIITLISLSALDWPEYQGCVRRYSAGINDYTYIKYVYIHRSYIASIFIVNVL